MLNSLRPIRNYGRPTHISRIFLVFEELLFRFESAL